MVCLRIESDDLAFENGVVRDAGPIERHDDLGILVRDPLQPARKCLHIAIFIVVNLHPLAVILVFDEHLAAHMSRDFVQILNARGQHHAHRRSGNR
jgi:hypothetical protein